MASRTCLRLATANPTPTHPHSALIYICDLDWKIGYRGGGDLGGGVGLNSHGVFTDPVQLLGDCRRLFPGGTHGCKQHEERSPNLHGLHKHRQSRSLTLGVCVPACVCVHMPEGVHHNILLRVRLYTHMCAAKALSISNRTPCVDGEN